MAKALIQSPIRIPPRPYLSTWTYVPLSHCHSLTPRRPRASRHSAHEPVPRPDRPMRRSSPLAAWYHAWYVRAFRRRTLPTRPTKCPPAPKNRVRPPHGGSAPRDPSRRPCPSTTISIIAAAARTFAVALPPRGGLRIGSLSCLFTGSRRSPVSRSSKWSRHRRARRWS